MIKKIIRNLENGSILTIFSLIGGFLIIFAVFEDDTFRGLIIFMLLQIILTLHQINLSVKEK